MYTALFNILENKISLHFLSGNTDWDSRETKFALPQEPKGPVITTEVIAM